MNEKKFRFANFCRICATESIYLQSLYHYTEDEKTFADMINKCTSISFYKFELRPKVICKDCVLKLKAAYEFYNLVRSSEEKFKTMVSSQILIKTETKADKVVKEPNFMVNIPTEYCKFEPKIELIEHSNARAEDVFIEKVRANLQNGRIDQPFIFDDSRFDRKCKYRGGRPKKSNKKQIVPVKQKTDVYRLFADFECYKCKKKFPSHFRVQTHLKEHDASRKCRVCLKKFAQYEFIKHLCKGSEIKCQYCLKQFHSTHTLVKHINGDHKDHPNYKCYECAKAFPSKELLEIHKPTHDDEEEKFVCDICGSRYRTRFQIKEHMAIKHSDTRTFLCATCGKSFSNSTYLRAHIKRHTATKPIQCPKCPKRFYDKYGLKKHNEVHDDAQFICDICGSIMRSKGSYSEHMRRHKKTKVYTCEVCSKQIKTSKYNYQLHLYTHSGEKPFKCSYCDRRYTQSADLNKHLRTHVGENTYKCDIMMCDKSFRLLRELRQHKSEHYIQSLTGEEAESVATEIQQNIE